MGKKAESPSTRERILQAAGELFAEKGFRAATVREICTRAGTNIAAVNYHFRDKEALLAEVVKYGFKASQGKYPLTYNFDKARNAKERLRQFICNFLIRLYDPDMPKWVPGFMARNFQFTHSHVRPLIQKQKAKTEKVLSGILKELMGKSADESRLRVAMVGIVGQLLFHTRPPLHGEDKVHFPVFKTTDDFEGFVDRVFAFSLGGVKSLMKLK